MAKKDTTPKKPQPLKGKETPVAQSNGTKSPHRKFLPWTLGVIVLIGALGGTGFYYVKYQDAKDAAMASVPEKNQEETSRVMSALKKNLLITESEEPTVARVDNPEQLKATNAEFYKDVQAGDYLIVYTKRAIIYRESKNQIINLAPIIDTNDTQPVPDSPVAPTTTNIPPIE